MNLDTLLQRLAAEGASDIHLRVGLPPLARREGRLAQIGGEPLRPQTIEQLLSRLGHDGKVSVRDRSLALGEQHRFRVHAFRVQGHWAVVLRVVPSRVPTLEELHLPPVYASLAELRRGLILIGGEAGSGRSVTLAALISAIVQRRAAHLVVVEEPIEHLYRDAAGSVSQIEVRTDAPSWEAALESAIRSDADVIALAQFRGERIVARALEAAEMGFLVIGVAAGLNPGIVLRELHQQVGPARHASLAASLAIQLRAVCTQRLVAALDGTRLAICEVLLPTAAVQDCIARSEYEELRELIAEDRGQHGMHAYDQQLLSLLDAGRIEVQTALNLADDKLPFEQRFTYGK